ncbi:MAG: alpha/beta hydrolase [Candidatus Heimdallarchaeota archaeon]|nr:alpha/beta hydrolase [Candidatus Heimdallarchaeota archaeon]MCK4612667.1 alpha/beta hydrolase [Candidatus Heimdallarchaeota archaeon]
MGSKIYETFTIDQSILDIAPELEQKVLKMLTATEKKVPNFWEIDTTESLYVPVDDGEIRVYHFKPDNPISKRSLVFVPGWGGTEIGFMDFYEVIHDKVECYYIETREKRSSKLDRKKAKLDMSQKARDIRDVINYLELDKEDFVLLGTCWGGAIILHGLIDGTIDAPTIVTQDPMHTLWFPKWFLRFVSPFLPVFVVRLFKPIIRNIQLRGMNEEVQRRRAETFIEDAELWKWKRSADSIINFELIGNISTITKEVVVTNGTKDKVHDQITYPNMAAEMPYGRFIYMKTDESRRERLIGLIALEFSKVTVNDGLPPSLRDFEKELPR